MNRAPQPRSLSRTLFYGFALSSIGGPLALASLYATTATGSAVSSAGFTAALGALVFVFPLAVWYRYSGHIAAAGGLYAFVESAAGGRAARAQGWIWTLSYFLYLPYTVAFMVYDLLPVVFPGVSPYRPAFEVLLPLALVLGVLVSLEAVLVVMLVTVAVQLVLVLVLGGLELSHVGAPLQSFVPHGGVPALGKGTGNISLLFICGSLPLFLGGEVRGGARAVRGALVASFLVVALYLVFAAFPLAGVASELRDSEIPGFAIAQAYGNRPLAIVVGLFTIASIGALVVAEFIALSRLLHAMLGRTVRQTLAAVGLPFVLADAVSLVNPDAFYENLLKPSLIALYVSQLIVFLVYPLFRKRRGRLAAADVVLAAAASGLMVYGLYSVAVNQLGL